MRRARFLSEVVAVGGLPSTDAQLKWCSPRGTVENSESGELN